MVNDLGRLGRVRASVCEHRVVKCQPLIVRRSRARRRYPAARSALRATVQVAVLMQQD
jgi:hypothetical protein